MTASCSSKLWLILPLILCLPFTTTGTGPSRHNSSINVIFDMGGVLVETDKITAFQEAGFSRFAWYLAAHPSKLFSFSTYLRQRLYDFLESIEPRHPDEAPLRDEHDRLIPQLMCNWFKGTEKPQEILMRVKTALKQSSLSQAEKNVLRGVYTMMFTPKKLVKTCRFIEPMVAFAKECHAQGHRLYILSNWDEETFSLFASLHPEFFALFDGIVLSGSCHMMKPHNDIYQLFLKQCDCDPANSIFIDDRPENVTGGEENGIKSVLCTKKHSSLPWSTTVNVEEIRHEVMAFARKRARLKRPAICL